MSTPPGLIYKHRYDSAHLCVFVSETTGPRGVGFSGGFMVLWSVFLMATPLVWFSRGGRGGGGSSIHTGGHVAIRGPSGCVCPSLEVATEVATAFSIS